MDKATETWEDLFSDDREESNLDQILQNADLDATEKAPSYDIQLFINYIALHRYMQFDESASRFLIEHLPREIPGVKIINSNVFSGGARLYELSNGYMVIPFTDLRDYGIKYMSLKKGDSKVYTYQAFQYLSL